VLAHGDALEGKGRGKWRMEWVASTRHTRLVRFAERRNLVSAHVPSRFIRSLHTARVFSQLRVFRIGASKNI